MANKYLITVGGNWSANSSWNTASNQATGNTTAPTSVDTAFLNQYSGNVTADTATCLAGTIDCSGYTNTITINTSCILIARVTLTLSATTLITNNGILSWGDSNSLGNINTAGVDIPGTFRFGGTGNSTRNLLSNLTCLGATTFVGQQKINGAYGIYLKNGISGGSNVLAGTCSLYMQGGKMDITAATANVYIDGNITVTSNSGTFLYTGIGYLTNATNFVYLSGSFTNTNSPIQVRGNVTFDTGSDIVFNKLYFPETTARTYTLLDDLYVNDISTEGGSGNANTINGAYKIKVAGSIRSYTTSTYYSNYFNGTATFEMIGTGTLGQASSVFGTGSQKFLTYIENNIEINTAGTITFGNIGVSGGGTLTYTTGTIAGTGGIYLVGTYTITGNFTLPLLSFGHNDRGQSNANVGPWVCNLLTDITTNTLTLNYNSILNITDTKTVTVATAFNSRGDSILSNVISSTGTGYINYTGTLVNMNLVHTDFTNIDSTNQLFCFKGSTTNCNNISIVDYTSLSAPLFSILEV